MIKFGSGKKKSVGLDIGSYSIKVSSIEKESGTNTLTAYNIKKIPLGKEDIDITPFIEELIKEIELRPETVNLSISGADVIVRFINLPKMKKEQLENALTFEAEKYIPFNINEVVLDFLILGDAAEVGQMQVLLAAAKREHVQDLINKVEKLGMTVNIIDIDSFAMFNAFTANNTYPNSDKGTVFLDLGHSKSDILISIGSLPLFMRQIRIGSRDITNIISNNLSISLEKADEYKRGVSGGENKEAVSGAMHSVLDDLIKEIQLSFGYFENRNSKAIGNIYCSGGMSYQEGVLDYLSDKLAIEVKRWNPLLGMNISESLSKEDIDLVSSQLAVSIGLALRD